jgi:small-conductance mechanosensitive channel
MASPNREEPPQLNLTRDTFRSSEEDGTQGTAVDQVESELPGSQQLHPDGSVDGRALRDRLRVETTRDLGARFEYARPSPSQTREEASRLDDDLAMMKVERIVTTTDDKAIPEGRSSAQLHRSRSRAPEPIDEFDAATNPLHEKTAIYKPPEHPSTKVAKLFKYVHGSSWLVRYITYIAPVTILLLIPLLIGALLPAGQDANVGGVQLVWFGIWLEIVWLTLWLARIIAKAIPVPFGLVSSLFTNNSKKWRDLGKQLEVPVTLFFWFLAIEISFLPTMKNHHVNGIKGTQQWETTTNKVIISLFVGVSLNFAEKIIIQLIAISFHLRTYQDRIDLNKFQIGSLTKLYSFSKEKIAMEDAEFEEKPSGPASGARTPGMYAERAHGMVNKAFAKVGDVAGTVAGDFTGKKVAKSGHPHQVVLALLNTASGSQVLARRLYRTFVRDGFETVFSGDLKSAFDNEEEAEAAFTMFDKDMNGDISMEELEAVCVEIGKERKSITASLKDLDSVVGKLDDVLFFVVAVITILVLISLLSTSASGVLTSAGSAVLALSWLFSATAQEFLQSVIFVFVKHPFDVGDRVSIYGNTGSTLKGDDYFVKEISLLFTEFKKMEGHVVQAPNSYLNTLFILNMRRSGGLAEALPIVIRFGTTLQQIDDLRQSLLEFVKAEKREYQGNILTELRDVTEAYSLTLNVVFFYKSNWQNELLRLQRRNKFICALMISMQNLGIEGPRRNIPGWDQENPYYMQMPPGAPPLYAAQQNSNENNLGGSGHVEGPVHYDEPIQPAPIAHPSVLRHRGDSNSGRTGRSRSESVSQMSKRVDFSLGMRDVSSGGNTLDDVYEERAQHMPEVMATIRESNRADDDRRIEEAAEREASRVTGRSASRGQERDRSNHSSGGMMRRSTTQSFMGRGHRASVSSQGIHRNRFLDRFNRNGRSIDLPRDSLQEVEEGRASGHGNIDPRSGFVGSQAVRMSTETDRRDRSPILPIVPTDSLVRDYEMQRMGNGVVDERAWENRD